METTEIEWCFHPFRRSYRTSAGVVASLVVLCVLVHAVFGDVLLTVLTALIMLASLWEFFLPSRYRLTADGVTINTVSGITERQWNEFTGFRVGRAGILLKTAGPAVLRFAGRGEVRLFFPEGEEDRIERIIALVKEKVEQERGESGSGDSENDS